MWSAFFLDGTIVRREHGFYAAIESRLPSLSVITLAAAGHQYTMNFLSGRLYVDDTLVDSHSLSVVNDPRPVTFTRWQAVIGTTGYLDSPHILCRGIGWKGMANKDRTVEHYLEVMPDGQWRVVRKDGDK